MSTVEARRELLAEAAEVVAVDRNSSYGEPEDSFGHIARMWSAYKGVPFEPHDVAIMQALVKAARISTTPDHRDSWLDFAGYAACGWSTRVDAMTKTT